MALDPSQNIQDVLLNNFDECAETLNFSDSERQVGKLFFSGMRQAEIADHLGESTVEIRRVISGIYGKMRTHFQRPSSL